MKDLISYAEASFHGLRKAALPFLGIILEIPVQDLSPRESLLCFGFF